MIYLLFCLPIHLIKFQYSDMVTFESEQVRCCLGVVCWHLVCNSNTITDLPLKLELLLVCLWPLIWKGCVMASSVHWVQSMCSVQTVPLIFNSFSVFRLWLLCIVFHFCSGRELLCTCSSSTRTPAVLRRTEEEMGARSGRLHGNGLIWQYQEKAWYFPQIKKQWSWISTELLHF